MARTLSTALIAAALAAALALSGCGSSGSATTTSGQSAAQKAAVRAAVKRAAAAVKAAEAKAPKGASPTLRRIYAQFPKPKPNPTVKASAKAIAAGEAACKGKTPLQVKEAFYAAATEEGNLEPASPEAKMIVQLPSYEAKASKEPSFVAGQLAADVYEATLPKAIAQYGYQGCIYSLARQLEQELNPR